jgi:hypothetical protein
MGFEDTFGISVAAKYFLDPRRVSLDSPSNPFIFYEGASGRGNRAIVPGGYFPQGDIETVFDTWRVGALFRGLVPEVNYQQNAPTKGTATTLSAAANPGDTTISVASATGFAVNDIIQIGPDFVLSELHKITAISGTTITISDGISNAKIASDPVVKITAPPYLHIFDIGGDGTNLPPMTIRVVKDIDEQVFRGSVVDQIRLSVNQNALLDLTASVISKDDITAPTPVAPAAGTQPIPYAGVHLAPAATLFDTSGLAGGDKDITSFIRGAEFTFNNNVSGEDGLRMGSRFPVELLGKGLEVSARLTLVFRNRDQYNDFWRGTTPQAQVGYPRDIELFFTIDANNTLQIKVFNAFLTAPASEVSGRDMIVQTLEYSPVQRSSAGANSQLAAIWLKNDQEFRYF